MSSRAFLKVFLTLLIGILFLASSIQRVSAGVGWSKTYGGTGDEQASSVIKTIDGGYAILGITESFGAGRYDWYFVKTDSSGNMEWNKTYGGESDDIASCVIQTSDGGYALAGSVTQSGRTEMDGCFVKTDSTGNALWNRTLGGTGPDGFGSIVIAPDGGYLLLGTTSSSGAGKEDIWLIKITSTGDLQWNMTYGGTHMDRGISGIGTTDGGYAIVGWTYSFGAGSGDAWLIKTDSIGNLQWNKTYGGKNEDSVGAIIQTTDGGYAITGYTGSFGVASVDFWLVKTDADGSMQWNKTYDGGLADWAFDVIQTYDGGYALAGSSGIAYGEVSDAWLVKTDSDGVMQ